MAIQVNGTTVIDNSRNLENIASIDATTDAAISAAGFSKTTGDITGVTAGSGITGGGTSGTVTVNHADTSSQGSVNNSGSTVIQDITLDTYGHITNINSTTLSTGVYSAISKAQTGYITLNGGLIIQWGRSSSIPGGGGSRYDAFPISFPNACFTAAMSITTSTFSNTWPWTLQISNSGVTFRAHGSIAAVSGNWIAIGH